jgi:hypothetical protein
MSGTIFPAPSSNGLTNPMTTAGDIIVAGTSGTPGRMAKGANNTRFGVNASGVLGYYDAAAVGSAFPEFTAPPALGTWTQVDVSTVAVYEEAQNRIHIKSLSGNSYSMLVRATPATPFTAEFAILLHTSAENYSGVGVVLRESSTGKMAILHSFINLLRMDYWSSPSGFDTGHTSYNLLSIGMFFFRLTDDGTNIYGRVGFDGVHFPYVWGPFGRTAYMAGGPNQIGFAARAGGSHAASPANATLYSYKTL